MANRPQVVRTEFLLSQRSVPYSPDTSFPKPSNSVHMCTQNVHFHLMQCIRGRRLFTSGLQRFRIYVHYIQPISKPFMCEYRQCVCTTGWRRVLLCSSYFGFLVPPVTSPERKGTKTNWLPCIKSNFTASVTTLITHLTHWCSNKCLRGTRCTVLHKCRNH